MYCREILVGRHSPIVSALAGMFQLPLTVAPPLPFRHLNLRIRVFLIFVLLFPAKISFAANVCTQYEMACSAQLRSYPLREADESSGWDTGSGWDIGSGMEDVPLYDEFFEPIQVFNFSRTVNSTEEKICECPSDVRCLPNKKNVIKLDEMVTLTFCDWVENIFRRSCHGARSLIRVIGRIHETGEALTSVSETFVFCKCDRGYQRIRVEAWSSDLYAFIYQCL